MPLDQAGRRDLTVEHAGLVAAHNRVRARHGLVLLEEDERLTGLASRHALDMARYRRMSHRGSDGATPFRRMERAGYRYVRAAENVAAGQVTCAAVMADWMSSPGHRRNILGPFLQIGTGYATDAHGTPYWCVTFGTPIPAENPSPGGSVVYP